MADVFISYARSDQKAARRLASVLEKAGYSLWWDADLPAHRSYTEEIESHLREARAVVVLWSKSAAESQWVRAEADVARGERKLVQLSLDGTIPPLPFNQIQCADLSGWRSGTRHAGMQKALASVGALVSGEPGTTAKQAPRRHWWDEPRMRWGGLGLVLLLVAAALLVPRYFGGSKEDRPVVAVLPFESLDNRDRSLVAGMWEDTRQAIGRNPQLLVLGPNTSEEIAAKDGKSAAKLADYLVDASIRSDGERIRVNANLVRTRDGSEIWNKSFDRRLDDVFQLQQEIAGQIEGHIRGRLAERGGVQPENIATSGEVYALYSDARAKIRRRDALKYPEAAEQLQKVVRMDANFAPGWATLAVAKRLAGRSVGQSDPESDARRAIALAPNLAAGHAALGFALRDGPAAEAALRKAVKLDPNDIEALNWLANSMDDSRTQEKLRLYTRVVEIEPLWRPALLNKLRLLTRRGNEALAAAELERLDAAGDKTVAGIIRVELAALEGDLSRAVAIGLPLYKELPAAEREALGRTIWQPLIQLGHFEIADRISTPPSDFVPYLRRSDPRSLDMIEERMKPAQFWTFGPLPIVASRVYLLNGQGSRLVAQYRAVAKSPQEFERMIGVDNFPDIVPSLAIALRQEGLGDQGKALLARAEELLPKEGESVDEQVQRARIYAAQGRRNEAMNLLIAARRAGWLPPYLPVHTDIALDPPLAELRADPRFERVRQNILSHLAREKAELGPVSL